MYYYPEFEPHLARLTSYLESGYLKISTGLKHEMPKPIPVIFYKTHSEFEQTNLFPAFVPEEVAAFTEPLLNRMVIPIDEPPDQLQGLITHEMTHAFAFDLIPRGIGYGIQQRAIPLWVDEGLADYFRGHLGAARPHDDPGRGAHRQRAEALAGGVRGLLRPPRLQHGPRLLRVHGVALRQGGDPAVPLHAAQGHPRRLDGGALQAGLPHDARGVRRRLRQVAEGALQAVPRQAAARTTSAATSPRTRRRRASPRPSASPRAPRARSRPSSPRTAPTARRTWCSSRRRTAR